MKAHVRSGASPALTPHAPQRAGGRGVGCPNDEIKRPTKVSRRSWATTAPGPGVPGLPVGGAHGRLPTCSTHTLAGRTVPTLSRRRRSRCLTRGTPGADGAPRTRADRGPGVDADRGELRPRLRCDQRLAGRRSSAGETRSLRAHRRLTRVVLPESIWSGDRMVCHRRPALLPPSHTWSSRWGVEFWPRLAAGVRRPLTRRPSGTEIRRAAALCQPRADIAAPFTGRARLPCPSAPQHDSHTQHRNGERRCMTW